MKKSVYTVLIFASLLLLVSSAAIAAECSGSWSVLPNYRPGSGGACAALGLNTHRAVCQPGQRSAIYCDDASGGRYRICRSTGRCIQMQHDSYGIFGFSDNFEYSQDDWRDFYDDRRDDRWDRRTGRHGRKGYSHYHNRRR